MTIGELAKAAEMTEYTLRYYEKKGLIRVMRDKNGRRCYTQNDIKWVQFIQKLKNTGMLLKDIEKYAQLRYEGDSTIKERLAMLQRHRLFVLEQQKKWKEYLKNLDDKIKIYETML